MTTETPPVATNIRRLRETKGWGTRELAAQMLDEPAGCDSLADEADLLVRMLRTRQRNVQRWEHGEVIPSWPQMVRLSDALGVEPYELWVTA